MTSTGRRWAWCNKVNSKIHASINEIPFERLEKEGLSPLKRKYIMDKINLRQVQKDCLISYAGNQYSVPAEYVGRDVAVVALDNLLAAYCKKNRLPCIAYRIRERTWSSIPSIWGVSYFKHSGTRRSLQGGSSIL